MPLYKNKYRSKTTRLHNWDYGANGAYYVTICTGCREWYLGHVENGEMVLSGAGEIANRYWVEIPEHFPYVELGEYIVMPNHLHGIIIINKNKMDAPVGTLHCNVPTNTHCNVPTNNNANNPGNNEKPKNQFMSEISPKQGTLSTIIRSYKSACTTTINEICRELSFSWQGRFHDHIIRDNESYQRISEYIKNNPKNWENDELYKKHQ